MVGLHAASRDERVGAAREGIGTHQTHLANLVSPERKRQRIVTLHEEAWPAAKRTPESR